MPSAAVRQALSASLACALVTAKTRGLDHVGLPSSAEAIASLCGVAKPHGGGETQEAARIALRRPAFCGLPTRQEAEQVLDVSVARQHECRGQFISLTKQRREVLGHPALLERLRITQGPPHVERLPSPKNRSSHQNIVQISTSYEEFHGPPLRNSAGL